MPFSLHHHAHLPVLFVQAKKVFKAYLLLWFFFLRLYHCYWKDSCQVAVLLQGSPFLFDRGLRLKTASFSSGTTDVGSAILSRNALWKTRLPAHRFYPLSFSSMFSSNLQIQW